MVRTPRKASARRRRRRTTVKPRSKRLRKVVARLHALEERYRLLSEALSGSAIALDSAGRIVQADRGVERLFGRKRGELRGRPFAVLFSSAERRRLAQTLGNMENGDGSRRSGATMESKGRRRDGSEFPVEVFLHPSNPDGRGDTVAIVRDISKFKELEEEQKRNLEELRQLDKAKSEFINITAHELYTPLAPIKAELFLLRKAPHDAVGRTERKSVDVVNRNILRLQQFVKSLLELSRMQVGKVRLEKNDFDLSALVVNTADLFESAARHGRVSIRVATPGRVLAHADERRIEQIVFNLLSNALKFTPERGRITVRVHRAGPRKARVEVEDTGIGIRPADMAKLFQPFSQIDKDRQRRQKGSGLGLYICKGIIEMHGGEVWAQSPGPGKGSTFGFTLPTA